MTGSGKRIDVLLVNPGSRTAVYQELGDRYSAIEPPSLAGLFATYLRKRGLSVAIVDNRPCTAGSTWPPLGGSRSRPRKFVNRKPTPHPSLSPSGLGIPGSESRPA